MISEYYSLSIEIQNPHHELFTVILVSYCIYSDDLIRIHGDTIIYDDHIQDFGLLYEVYAYDGYVEEVWTIMWVSKKEQVRAPRAAKIVLVGSPKMKWL